MMSWQASDQNSALRPDLRGFQSPVTLFVSLRFAGRKLDLRALARIVINQRHVPQTATVLT